MATTNRAFTEKLGGTTATNFVGNQGDLFYDPTTSVLRVSDGSTAGGVTVGSQSSQITDGNTTIEATSTQLSVTGHVIPTSNDTYDLGNAEYKWRDFYLSDATIYTDSGKLSVGSTSNSGEGGDNLVSGTELKQIVASSTSWEDFQQRMMNFNF
jgi:hypothetical protein